MDFKKLANEVQEKVVAFRRDLHMNPEPSLQEFRTTKQIAAALDELGVPNLYSTRYTSFDAARGTGVTGLRLAVVNYPPLNLLTQI